MSKMLGQDIVTQEEFDQFLETKFTTLQDEFAQFKAESQNEIEELNTQLTDNRIYTIVSFILGAASIIGLAIITFI